jgi:hypothetical protein
MARIPLSIRFLLICTILTFVSSTALAQFRASLRGTVTDSQGAAVAGAKVTLTDTSTNKTLEATSSDTGLYEFDALPPNPFRLTVEHDGFKKRVLEHLVIIPEQPNALDLKLEVGQVQTTVTVSDTVQALDTETATLSGTITSNQIQHMPSFNRDVFQLAQLAPGVFGDASQGGGGGSYELPGNQGPGGSNNGQAGIFATENGPQIQGAGGQYETNSITVDGISTVSAVWGGTSVITPSEDSVQDMKVVSNNYDAEYGRFSGAQIQIISKGGTNDLHGSFFFKMSRPGLDAYQTYNGLGSLQPGTAAQRGLNRDDARFNNYGGSVGGPIWKNKVFAFFNWETSPLTAKTTAQGWYETSQFDALTGIGPIASKYLSHPGNGVSSSAIIARTCTQVGLTEGTNCATITSGSGAPEGLDVGSPLTTGIGMQDLTYGGNQSTPGVGGGLDGVPDVAFFNTVNPTTTSQNQYNGRVDADLTQKDRLSFTIYWVPVTTTDYNGPTRAENLWHHQQINDAFSLIWNHTFTPTLLNQARVNAAGWRWNEVATNPQEPFGLPQANIANLGSANINFFGAPGPSNFDQWTYSFNDVLTKIVGRHSIKAGGEVTRLYFLQNPTYNARPSFNFQNLWDFANDAPVFEGGQFNSKNGEPFANRQDNRESLWGVFVQDDFKLRQNLTINMGLRYSYFGALYSTENNLDVLQFGSGANTLTGMHVRVGGNLYTPQKNNFGPVVGFAWSPNRYQNKTVIRGGFGISYNQNEIAITSNGVGNPPNAVNASFNCPFLPGGVGYTTNPSCAGTGILYQTATNINSLFGYPPNSAAITTFGSNNLPICPSPCGSPIGVTGFPSNPKTTAIYHYSLDIQEQLPFKLVFMLGYQGNESRHLLVQNNFNAIGATQGLALNPGVQSVDFYENAGTGNYNALIGTLTHNFSRGFQATAQYTWSKAMDENSGPYYEDPYPFNTSAAYGRASYNATNAFKLYGLWQPVFFHGSHSWIEKVAGGWSLSGIWNVHSGFPWSPFYGLSNQVYYASSGYGSLRPAVTLPGAGMSTSNSTFEQKTNPNYGGNGTTFFVAPTYVAGPGFPAATTAAPTPGIQRDTLNGPGYNDVDASLSKAFGLPRIRGLGENARFEIRADAFNLFNKTNLNTGCIDSYLGQANPNGTLNGTPNSDFGVIGCALGSRTVQLQARFSF